MRQSIAKTPAPRQQDPAPVFASAPAVESISSAEPSFPGAPGRAPAWNFAQVPATSTTVHLQPKLTIGAVDHPLEREADDTADRVMRMADPAASPATTNGSLQRKCAACEEEEEEQAHTPAIQRRAGLNHGSAPQTSPSQLTQPGSGRPLDSQARTFFESRFSRDFSGVRIYTGPEADTAARAVNALAYTAGPNVVFRRTAYSPDSTTGRHLLAHELAHVVQQGHAPGRGHATPPTNAPAIQRRQFDPTTTAPANNLNNVELAEAIEQTEDLQRSLVLSPDVLDRVRDNLKLLLAERQARNHSNPLTEGNRTTWREGQAVSKLGIVQMDTGAWFYSTPGSVPLKRLPLNEPVAVERIIPGNWYLVVTRAGEPGYMDAAAINTSMPDPEATLYRIQPGDTAIGIAKKSYKGFKYGEDQRYYVNVLVLVNHQAKRPGIKNKTLDASGEGRADIDWESSDVFSGMQIWIPGQAYAKTLRAKIPTGSISYDALTSLGEFLSSIGEFLLGTLAFIAGILHGALESLWDLLVGLVDLVKVIYSLVKSVVLGSIIEDISSFWDTIKNIKLSEVFDVVSDWLDKKWNAPGTWDRWHFRGWLIGYIIMEILMLVASDGLITGLKWIGKVAKLEKLIAKIPLLAKAAEAIKDLKQAGKLKAVIEGTKVAESLMKARKWAGEVLAIPLEILGLLTEAAIGELKKLPAWAVERFRELGTAAMKVVLGCASPCKVNVAKIVEHLAGLAEKGSVGAKKLLNKSEILSALPKKLNATKIAEYLEKYPALMKVIRKAELTDADLAILADFLTGADAANPETAYKTFIRYLTNVVPAKTGNDINKFNTIMEDMMTLETQLSDAEKLSQIRQGSALKGSMFEAFVRMHVPEFQGKAFRRVRFSSKGALELATESRSSDFFVDATGELWDFKNSLKVDLPQARDYIKILNHTEAGLPKVTSINYLFASKTMAEANKSLKDLGIIVRYVSSAGMAVL